MFDKILNIVVNNIMIVLSLLLIIALIIGKVNIITSILVFGMWFAFGYISFTKGVEVQVEDEMKEYYRQKLEEEYNKKQNEIRNN
jgi:Ca2+/Na+ antiporter